MRNLLRSPATLALWIVICASGTLLPAVSARAQSPSPGMQTETPQQGWERYVGKTLVGVDWLGLEAGSDDQLSKLTGWTVGAQLTREMWNEAGPNLHSLYSTEGYFDFRVTGIELSETAAGIRATIRVDEGKRYRLEAIRFVGLRSLSPEEASDELGVKEGDDWSLERIESGIDRLLDRYQRDGRPFAQVHVREVTLYQGAAELELLVVESDTVWVESVVVSGLGSTQTSLVDRIVGPLENRPYDENRTAAVRSRLLALGVFSRVGAPQLEMIAPSQGRIHFEVAEAPTNLFEGAFGYQGQNQQVVGLARLEIGNLAGTARQLKLFWEGRGDGITDFQLGYREPFVFGLPVRADLYVEQMLQAQAYTQTLAGLSATMVLADGADATLGLEMGRVVVGAGDVQSSSRKGFRLQFDRRIGLPIEHGYGLRSGSYDFSLLLGYDLTTDRLRTAGDRQGHLTTLGFDANMLFPRARNRFFQLGLVTRLRSSETPVLPLYDLFPLGGARSLRGYREDAFRASRFGLLRAEYGFFVQRTRLFAFLDQAVFYRASGDPLSTWAGRTSYRAGYGVGTSHLTRVGRLAMLLGWGEGTRPLDAKLHLQLISRF